MLTANALTELALKCRVYVGSLPYEGVSEEDIRNAFSPFGIILNINHCMDAATGKSRGFCFIDYAAPESASEAINKMNGYILGGRSIRVGLPFGNPALGIPNLFTGIKRAPVTTVPGGGVQLAGAISQLNPQTGAVAPPSVPGSRIYVGSINYELTAAEIKALFDSYGTVRSCQLLPNPETGKHKGFGFIEFESAESAAKAIAAMDGFTIAGRNLRVRPATSSVNNNQFAMLQTAGSDTGVSKKSEESLSKEEDMTISGNQRYMIMQKLARTNDQVPVPGAVTNTTQGRIVCLRNMVSLEELDESLEEEVTSECTKYGPVERVVVYQQPGTPNILVYVIFKTSDGATKAVSALDKRWFGGRSIAAEVDSNPPEVVLH